MKFRFFGRNRDRYRNSVSVLKLISVGHCKLLLRMKQFNILTCELYYIRSNLSHGVLESVDQFSNMYQNRNVL